MKYDTFFTDWQAGGPPLIQELDGNITDNITVTVGGNCGVGYTKYRRDPPTESEIKEVESDNLILIPSFHWLLNKQNCKENNLQLRGRNDNWWDETHNFIPK